MRYFNRGYRGLFLICALGLSASSCKQVRCAQSVQTTKSASGRAEVTVEITSSRPELVREIADLNNGSRWLLLRDASNPGGPGRLMQENVENADLTDQSRKAILRKVSKSDAVPQCAIIRAGDRLLIEEHSPVFDARFEGVALQPAVAGGSLAVRLTVNGKIIRAIAKAPGRAIVQRQAEKKAAQ
jgi:hypothetical protein